MWNIPGLGGGGEVNERHSAKDAKGRAPRGGWVVRAHVGPPIERGGGARMGPLLRIRNGWEGVLVGNCGVGFFYFSVEGGCAKVVPKAHRVR